MKTSIKIWKSQLEECEQKAKKIRQIIKNIQDVCEHKHPDGKSAFIEYTGQNYRYEECQICEKKIDMR